MPSQQNPQTPGVSSGIETIMSEKGFSSKDSFNVEAGGQSVFNTSKEIGGNVSLFEDGVLT